MAFRMFLATILSAAALPAAAQKSGTGMSSAPGMPLVVGGKPSFYAASMPRFWTTQDSITKVAQQYQIFEWLQKQLFIPDDFLEHKDYTLARGTLVSAHFEFQVVVRPDGITKKPALMKQEISNDTSYSPESLSLLVKEAERKLGQLRFAPADTQDTVMFPITFWVR